MKPLATEKKKNSQTWPYVTWSEKKKKWIVDARTKTGGHRKYFDKKAHAETYAQSCRGQRDGQGVASFGSDDLAAFGKSVQDAITFYLDYLRKNAKTVPLESAIAELIEVRGKAGRSAGYCYDLELRLGRFAKSFPARSVASFTARDLDEWLSGLPVAPGTRNTFRRDLCTLFSFCEKRGYCPANEASKTERAKAIDKPAEILTTRECSALLSECGADTLPFVAVGLFAGLRTAELKKLDWSEIDLESRMIEVKAAKSKTARRRLVPISDNLASWLAPLAAPEGALAPFGLRKRFNAVKARAGLSKWPSNALRHSFGSYRLAQCHDAARVSLEMGNSPQMVFAHYRELVRPRDAALFWQIARPKDENAA